MTKLAENLRSISNKREALTTKFGEDVIEWENDLMLSARNGERRSTIKIDPKMIKKFIKWAKDNDITILSYKLKTFHGGSAIDFDLYSYKAVEFNVNW